MSTRNIKQHHHGLSAPVRVEVRSMQIALPCTPRSVRVNVVRAFALVLLALPIGAYPAAAGGTAGGRAVIPAPTAKDWIEISKLPDLSGTWIPDMEDQSRQVRSNPAPWTEAAQKRIDQMLADQRAGRPFLVFPDCLPENHPSWMLISHNAMEILMTPGRVTMLGEVDANRLRRIYTDGRSHPEHVAESFQGYSIGRWEGTTLVVDTIGVFPQAPIAISEAVGIPNNGDMRVSERIRLEGDTLYFDLEITAPKVFTKPWKTTRIWYRKRERDFEVLEATCVGGRFLPDVNADGDHVWRRIEYDADGTPIPFD